MAYINQYSQLGLNGGIMLYYARGKLLSYLFIEYMVASE